MLRCEKRKNESNYGIVAGIETLVVAGAFFSLLGGLTLGFMTKWIRFVMCLSVLL